MNKIFHGIDSISFLGTIIWTIARRNIKDIDSVKTYLWLLKLMSHDISNMG